jgi:hypothetical protein
MLSAQTSEEHMRDMERQYATLRYYLFQLNYPLYVSNKQVHYQEVISVHAAYSISHASMGVPSRQYDRIVR